MSNKLDDIEIVAQCFSQSQYYTSTDGPYPVFLITQFEFESRDQAGCTIYITANNQDNMFRNESRDRMNSNELACKVFIII